MVQLTFEDLSFAKDKDSVKVSFLKNFYFNLTNESLNKIGEFEIATNSISFKDVNEHNARTKFDFLLTSGFKNLRNKLTNKKTVYIHKNSGIPLIGTNYFGLIDRGSNIIEVKPITSCNIACVFCSVDEGPISRRKIDFVVEKDYIVEEYRKIAEFKKTENMDAHINAQGEPTLYADMPALVKGIMDIPNVKTSSIDTNGTLLSEKFIDELAEAGLTRINLSLNALDQDICNKIAGRPYNLKRVKEMARYIPKKMDLIIAPVWMPGVNDSELPKLAKFAVEVGAGKNCPPIGIQNMLFYKHGRNPVKTVEFDDFYKRMHEIEKESGVQLIFDKHAFNIEDLPELPKPFKKGQTVECEIMLPGRIGREKLGVALGRLISIPNCHKEIGSRVKVKIKRTKHNIFVGEMLG